MWKRENSVCVCVWHALGTMPCAFPSTVIFQLQGLKGIGSGRGVGVHLSHQQSVQLRQYQLCECLTLTGPQMVGANKCK